MNMDAKAPRAKSIPKLTVPPTSQPLSEVIGQVAVLAAVQTSSLGMSRLDKRASSDADQQHHAKEGTGKLSVNRMPGAEPAVTAIKQKQGEARRLLFGRTTQFGADRRLLLNIHINEFVDEFGIVKKEHDRLVAKFVDDAATYIFEAQKNLGNYNVTPPTRQEIARAFSLDFELSPVPNVGAFQASGGGELEKQLKSRFEDDIRAAWGNAQKELIERLAEPLENLVDRMKAYEARERLKKKGITPDKSGTFKSTVISNVTSVAEIFRSFNIENDPQLTEIADKLAEFEGIEHGDLTGSADLRKQVAKRAAEIRQELSAWL
jgi:hypothetical protein